MLEKKELALITAIVVMFLVSLYLYPIMPDKMPVHWNGAGEIDGYGSKFMALFLFPLVLAGIYLLFLFLPKLMIYKENFQKFKSQFFGFKLIFILFFITIYISTLLPNIGITINMSYIMIPALAVLFFYIGYMFKFTKRNYFIGIRTPWTLASENVWDKTHKLGSKLFMIASLFMLSAILFKKAFVWFILIPILSIVVVLFVYSYLEYKKEKR
jgi:uncharacterized membrane protein